MAGGGRAIYENVSGQACCEHSCYIPFVAPHLHQDLCSLYASSNAGIGLALVLRDNLCSTQYNPSISTGLELMESSMKPKSSGALSEAILHQISILGISKAQVRQLLNNPDKTQLVQPSDECEYTISKKYIPAKDLYMVGIYDNAKNTLDDVYAVYPSLMDDIEDAEPYEVLKELIAEFGLPFNVDGVEHHYIEYARRFQEVSAGDDSIEILKGDLPDDTAFAAHIGLKQDTEGGKKIITYYMAFVINMTEYGLWLYGERIRRGENVRIFLPETHSFPASLQHSVVKDKLRKLREQGTMRIGMELFTLLSTQKRMHATIFCYKYNEFELALYIERSTTLVFQHYDTKFGKIREVRIPLSGLPLGQRKGEIGVSWSRGGI